MNSQEKKMVMERFVVEIIKKYISPDKTGHTAIGVTPEGKLYHWHWFGDQFICPVNIYKGIDMLLYDGSILSGLSQSGLTDVDWEDAILSGYVREKFALGSVANVKANIIIPAMRSRSLLEDYISNKYSAIYAYLECDRFNDVVGVNDCLNHRRASEIASIMSFGVRDHQTLEVDHSLDDKNIIDYASVPVNTIIKTSAVNVKLEETLRKIRENRPTELSELGKIYMACDNAMCNWSINGLNAESTYLDEICDAFHYRGKNIKLENRSWQEFEIVNDEGLEELTDLAQMCRIVLQNFGVNLLKYAGLCTPDKVEQYLPALSENGAKNYKRAKKLWNDLISNDILKVDEKAIEAK